MALVFMIGGCKTQKKCLSVDVNHPFDLEIEASQMQRPFMVVCEDKDYYDSLSHDDGIYNRYYVKLETPNTYSAVLAENITPKTTYGVAKIYYTVNILTVIGDDVDSTMFIKLYESLMLNQESTKDLIGIKDVIFNPHAFVLTCYDQYTYCKLLENKSVTEMYTVKLVDICNKKMFDISYEDGVGVYVNYDLIELYDKEFTKKYRFVDHASN